MRASVPPLMFSSNPNPNLGSAIHSNPNHRPSSKSKSERSLLFPWWLLRLNYFRRDLTAHLRRLPLLLCFGTSIVFPLCGELLCASLCSIPAASLQDLKISTRRSNDRCDREVFHHFYGYVDGPTCHTL